jgi:hypothetical protein
MVRCDTCNQDIAALDDANPLAGSGLTAQQVMQAYPQVATQVFRHEADCPAARPPVTPASAGAGAGPLQQFIRKVRWSVLVLFIGLGLFATSLLWGPDAEPGGVPDRVIFPLLLGVGGALTLLGLWWTARALAKIGS